MTRIALSLTCLVFLAGLAFADHYESRWVKMAGDIYDECVTEMGGGSGTNKGGRLWKCLYDRERMHGKNLEAAYKKILAAANKKTAQALRESQRAWLTYQEKQCRWQAARSADWAVSKDAAEKKVESEDGYVRCLLWHTLEREDLLSDIAFLGR